MNAHTLEPQMPESDPQRLAERVRDAMWVDDRACQALGMRVVEVAPGQATLTMPVREDMLNGHAICHACNAYNELAGAAGFAIDLIAPGRLGDVLSARCAEVSKAGRTGVYDTEVTNQRGERIAVFRGRSYTMKGKPVVAD